MWCNKFEKISIIMKATFYECLKKDQFSKNFDVKKMSFVLTLCEATCALQISK